MKQACVLILGLFLLAPVWASAQGHSEGFKDAAKPTRQKTETGSQTDNRAVDTVDESPVGYRRSQLWLRLNQAGAIVFLVGGAIYFRRLYRNLKDED